MAEATRSTFHRTLDHIDEKVINLFALVAEGLTAATDALLSGDAEPAKLIAEREALIDSLYHDVEELVQLQIALQQPAARDMRFLLSVLRIVPELERSGDLTEHIARRATRGMAPALSPRVRGLVTEMGRVGADMWRIAADGYARRDPEVAEALADKDDEMDDLHVSLTAELAGTATVATALVIELTLINRFYERLGDHAVNVARRVRYMAGVTGR